MVKSDEEVVAMSLYIMRHNHLSHKVIVLAELHAKDADSVNGLSRTLKQDSFKRLTLRS